MSFFSLAFWQNFAANLIASIIGVLIGAGIALWWDRRTRKNLEQTEKKKAEEQLRWELTQALRAVRNGISNNAARILSALDYLKSGGSIYFNVDPQELDFLIPELLRAGVDFELFREINKYRYELVHLARKIDTQYDLLYGVASALADSSSRRAEIINSIIAHSNKVIQMAKGLEGAIDEQLTKEEISMNQALPIEGKETKEPIRPPWQWDLLLFCLLGVLVLGGIVVVWSQESPFPFLYAVAAFSIAFAIHYFSVSVGINGVLMRDKDKENKRREIREIEYRIVGSGMRVLAGGLLILIAGGLGVIFKGCWVFPWLFYPIYGFGSFILFYSVLKYVIRQRGWPRDVLNILLPNEKNKFSPGKSIFNLILGPSEWVERKIMAAFGLRDRD